MMIIELRRDLEGILGRFIDGRATIDEVKAEVGKLVLDVSIGGNLTVSDSADEELLGILHESFGAVDLSGEPGEFAMSLQDYRATIEALLDRYRTGEALEEAAPWMQW